jgi:hypothetical protein
MSDETNVQGERLKPRFPEPPHEWRFAVPIAVIDESLRSQLEGLVWESSRTVLDNSRICYQSEFIKCLIEITPIGSETILTLPEQKIDQGRYFSYVPGIIREIESAIRGYQRTQEQAKHQSEGVRASGRAPSHPEDRCRTCGKRIKYKAGARRRIYCGDSCKQTHYRLRKKLGSEPIPLAESRASWEKRGYPEPMIEALLALCQKQTDPVFLYDLETALMWHKHWLTNAF